MVPHKRPVISIPPLKRLGGRKKKTRIPPTTHGSFRPFGQGFGKAGPRVHYQTGLHRLTWKISRVSAPSCFQPPTALINNQDYDKKLPAMSIKAKNLTEPFAFREILIFNPIFVGVPDVRRETFLILRFEVGAGRRTLQQRHFERLEFARASSAGVQRHLMRRSGFTLSDSMRELQKSANGPFHFQTCFYVSKIGGGANVMLARMFSLEIIIINSSTKASPWLVGVC